MINTKTHVKIEITTSVEKKTPCKFWPNCNKGKECPFFHPGPSTNLQKQVQTSAPTKTKESKTENSQKVCIFFVKGNCTKKDCKFSHDVSVQTQLKIEKKDKPCVWWNAGNCKKGDACPFQHLPRKPKLEEILLHDQSITATPNVNEGIFSIAPKLPGLPPLPPNGKGRMTKDKHHVIYFIPFFKPIDGRVYFKKIRLFRFNQTKGEFKLVYSYTKPNFHITTADASNGYLVLSRLPYDASVLKMMEQAKRLQNNNEKLRRRMQEKDEKLRSQIERLKAKNRYLSDKVQNVKASYLREQAKAKNLAKTAAIATQTTTKLQQKIDTLQNQIFENFRARDPVDIFVYDPVIKAHVHVLEYHKPADHVDLDGKVLKLWDKKTNKQHVFKLKMTTNKVNQFDVDDPLQPKQLCPEF